MRFFIDLKEVSLEELKKEIAIMEKTNKNYLLYQKAKNGKIFFKKVLTK